MSPAVTVKLPTRASLRRGPVNIRELTNRRLSHDGAAGSRHSSALPSCRNLNLRFVVKTTTLVRAAGKFSRRFWSLFSSFTSKLICSTKMSKFRRETRARFANAYGNRFTKDRVFHCNCTFMRFVNKLRVNYGFRRDNKGRMQGAFINREDIYKLAEQL